MSELVIEDDLARARSDPDFRQQLLTQNLERLLDALNQMSKANDTDPTSVRQIREGVDLAVKLADRRPAAAERPQSGPAGGLTAALAATALLALPFREISL